MPTDNRNQASHMSHFSIIRESPGNTQQTQLPNTMRQPSELKFKIEPIGVQPEDDDDLETCPSRTRSSWPHQIIPWWKPADRFEKPPYSYATLIAHAILTSKDGRLTLSDIYKWISEAYPYYKRGQKGWQNSIRHNLSLNKRWFIKVDRRPTQAHPGKGGYWTLQVNMEKIFVDNLSQAGGHSRRHHDMGMYSSLSTPYYNASSNSENGEEVLNLGDRSANTMSPNIFITRPEDYEAKKNKSAHTISAPRHRNMTSQEKKKMKTNQTESAVPKTDPKTFIMRVNPLDPVNKRRKSTDPSRPPPKAGKRRNPVEPGSSTSEPGDGDSAVDVGSCEEPLSKKRKSTTTAGTTDTIDASLNLPSSYTTLHDTKPSDVIGSMPSATNNIWCLTHNNDFMFYNEAAQPTNLLLTSEYPMLFDMEAQNILNGLQSTVPVQQQQQQQHPDMKTIDLQTFALEKNVHYSNAFSIDDFSDPNSNLFIPDLNSCNLDQFFDLNSNLVMDDPPSDLLVEDDVTMNTFWPATMSPCYNMNFDTNDMSFPLYE